jgi:hypothetical protein
MRQLYQLDLSGVAGRHTLPILMTKEKAQAMKTVAAEKEFPGLDGDALKAAEAIFRMDKPWGPGSASELCDALGDWDGEGTKKSAKSRANTLGRYLKKIQSYLAEKGVILEIGTGKKPYSVDDDKERISEAKPVNLLQAGSVPTFPDVPTQV